jgi:hypothetical protein
VIVWVQPARSQKWTCLLCVQGNFTHRRALEHQDSASHVERLRIEALQLANADHYMHEQTPPPDSPTFQSDPHTPLHSQDPALASLSPSIIPNAFYLFSSPGPRLPTDVPSMIYDDFANTDDQLPPEDPNEDPFLEFSSPLPPPQYRVPQPPQPRGDGVLSREVQKDVDLSEVDQSAWKPWKSRMVMSEVI